MAPRAALTIHRTPASVAPSDRGRLLEPHEIATVIFNDKIGAKWVLANVPKSFRHKIGRLILYYENEVRMWVETLRVA